MTIDREKLIALLVEKTGLDREQVEGQLTELIQRIQRAAEAGKSFEIEGFGTFTMKDDVLNFEPSEKLETEINNRYAGMKPIELIGAFREPEEGEIPDVAPDTESGSDIPETDDKEDGENRQPVSAEEPLPVVDEPAEEPESIDEAEKAEKLLQKELSADISDADRVSEAETKRKQSTGRKKSEDPIGKFLVALVVVLTIGVGGWFVYDLGVIGSSGNASSPSTGQSTASSVSGDQQDPAHDVDSENTSPENPDEELNRDNEVTGNAEEREDGSGGTEGIAREEPDEQSTYGLYGAPDNGGPGGYTIVVHSLQNRRRAETMRERLNSEGYRTILAEATINGETYFRVGIGRFETVSNAQKAAAELPDRFKNNHFIRRI